MGNAGRKEGSSEESNFLQGWTCHSEGLVSWNLLESQFHNPFSAFQEYKESVNICQACLVVKPNLILLCFFRFLNLFHFINFPMFSSKMLMCLSTRFCISSLLGMLVKHTVYVPYYISKMTNFELLNTS